MHFNDNLSFVSFKTFISSIIQEYSKCQISWCIEKLTASVYNLRLSFNGIVFESSDPMAFILPDILDIQEMKFREYR